MTSRRQLTSDERDTISKLFTSRMFCPRDVLQDKARDLGVTFETVARAITTEVWQLHQRSCVECGSLFFEKRPPFIEPRHVVCAECVSLRCPAVRISMQPRPKPADRSRRLSFDVACARNCGRRIHGYLTKPDNPVPSVCVDCISEDLHQETLRVWREEHCLK